MIKRLLILALCIIPVVALAQTKPKKITTRSHDRAVIDLASQTDKAFDECYFRIRWSIDSLHNRYVNSGTVRARGTIYADTLHFENDDSLWIITDTTSSSGGIFIKHGNLGLTVLGDAQNSNTGQVLFREHVTNGPEYVSVAAPTSIASSWEMTLPSIDGSTDDVLRNTNGIGALGWTSTITQETVTAKKRVMTDTLTVQDSDTLWILADTADADGKIIFKGGNHPVILGSDVTNLFPGWIALSERRDNGLNYVSFMAPNSVSSNVLWTLPSADGAASTALVTNGSGTLSFARPASSWTGDTLFQHVFDTVLGASETFRLPIAFTSASSYRVTCTPTNDNTAAGEEVNWSQTIGARDNLAIVRVINLTSSTFTVTSVGYTDHTGLTVIPAAGDSLTCHCVASGR